MPSEADGNIQLAAVNNFGPNSNADFKEKNLGIVSSRGKNEGLE